MAFQKLPASSRPQPPSTNGPEPQTASRTLVTERVRLLFGCYRQGEANDSTTYTVAVASMLLRYSEDVVISVTDPVTGLPSRLKWLPAVSEVRDECERLTALRSPAPERRREIEDDGPSDEERAVVAAKWRQLRDELGGVEKATVEQTPLAKALVAGDTARARGLAQQMMAGVVLSEAARRKFARAADDYIARDDYAGMGGEGGEA